MTQRIVQTIHSAELRDLRRLIHRTIKKVTDDIEGRFHFNTAIAAIMELLNAVSVAAQTDHASDNGAAIIREGLETIIILLAPFVPHAANELWEATAIGKAWIRSHGRVFPRMRSKKKSC